MYKSLLSSPELEALTHALYYLKMIELKNICSSLDIPNNDTKANLISSIILFLKTGSIKPPSKIPAASCAKRGTIYPLKPNTLMLFGNYKNDLKTRMFMKELIGDYFHFTAFGIDWLKERWHNGNPPTYAEFAQFWIDEYDHRKKEPAKPKAEWAYINLVQGYIKQNPHASKLEITKTWMNEQAKNRDIVHRILKKLSSN